LFIKILALKNPFWVKYIQYAFKIYRVTVAGKTREIFKIWYSMNYFNYLLLLLGHKFN